MPSCLLYTSGEQVLQDRGYKFVKGEKSGAGSYTYWRQTRTGQCIVVRTAEGRYQSLVTALKVSCQDGAAESAPAPGPGRFATVCGVTADGKPYRLSLIHISVTGRSFPP